MSQYMKRLRRAPGASGGLTHHGCIFYDQEATILCLHASGHPKSNTGILFWYHLDTGVNTETCYAVSIFAFIPV